MNRDAIDDAMRTVQEQMDYEVRGAWRAGYDYLHVFEENPLHDVALGTRDLSEEAVTFTQYTYPSDSDEPKRLEHDGIVYSYSYDFTATPDHVIRGMIEQQAGIPSDVGVVDE